MANKLLKVSGEPFKNLLGVEKGSFLCFCCQLGTLHCALSLTFTKDIGLGYVYNIA